jgi:type VII secretion-associated serine protease mycosin
MPSTLAHSDQTRDSQWHLRFLNVAAAQRLAQGEGVRVAVIDTGVDPHPDLRANLVPGTAIAPNAAGDGRHDAHGHGTGMAGLIAAHGGGNANGALGIAPRAKIVPVAADYETNQSNNETVAAGIEWAITQNIDVINLSSGGGPSPRLRAAVSAALAADIVVVAAVGNKPGVQSVQFPAFYPGVLAVGATDRTGNLAKISVTGRGVVLVAPGVDIMTTRPRGTYGRGTGTSDAAAIVSGAAALVRSRYPDLSAEEVVHRLTATATDKGAPGPDEEYGHGVLNLVAALTAGVPPLTPSARPPTPSPSRSSTAGGPAEDDPLVLPITLGTLAVIAGVIGVLAVRSRARRGRVGQGR